MRSSFALAFAVFFVDFFAPFLGYVSLASSHFESEIFRCCDMSVQLFAHSLKGLFLKLFHEYVKEGDASPLGEVYVRNETLIAKLCIDTSLEGGGLISEHLFLLISGDVFLIDQALLHQADLLQRVTNVNFLAYWSATPLWLARVLVLKLLYRVANHVFIERLVVI